MAANEKHDWPPAAHHCAVALFALACFGAAELGRWFSIEPCAFVTFRVTTGLALAVLLRSRPGRWPGLLLGLGAASLAFHLLHGKSAAGSAGLVAANVLEA